jgi:hypothetical protein
MQVINGKIVFPSKKARLALERYAGKLTTDEWPIVAKQIALAAEKLEKESGGKSFMARIMRGHLKAHPVLLS